MSSYGASSRAGSTAPLRRSAAGPGPGGSSFLSRLASAGPSASGNSISAIGDSVDMRSTPMAMDLDDDGDGGTLSRVPDALFHTRVDGDGGGEVIFPAALLGAGPEEEELDDLRRLARAWVRERGTPVVLAWEGDLLDSVLDKLEQQQKMLATLRADPSTSEEEHFRLVLVQTEMERAKYLVRSYVRTRLHKIEKFAQHIVDTPTLHVQLSGAELAHAQKYAALVATHYQHSVLDSLPDWLQRLDETSNTGVSMVSKPNLATPVLVYCRKDCGEIPLERGEVAVLAEGTTHILRYDLVERWIALGWAEVL